jgi:hypothetical protein
MVYVYDDEMTPEENELLEILSLYELIDYKDLIVGNEYAYFNTRSPQAQCAVYAGTLIEKKAADNRQPAKAIFKNARCVDVDLANEGSLELPKYIPIIASEKTTIFYEQKTQAAGKKSRRGKTSRRRKNKKQKTKRTKRRR